MELFWLYLILKLDAMQSTLVFILVIATLALIFWTIGALCTQDECREKNRIPFIKLRYWVCYVMGGIILTLMPTSKDATILAAGYGILEVTKTDTAKRLASKSVDLIEQFLEKHAQKIMEEKVKK